MMDPNQGFPMDMPPTETMGMDLYFLGQQQDRRQQSHQQRTIMSMPTSPEVATKRQIATDAGEDSINLSPPKKQRTEAGLLNFAAEDSTGPAPVPASKTGITFFGDMDVLSGRGGGTNVHPGNRNFRDLINLHRRAYLKARKNDKPNISRSIVRSIRDSKGRFLKKDERTGLWLEIGDDAAREKTSQALRQRAPEMRRLLFDTEREEARSAEEHLLQQHQQLFMGINQGGIDNTSSTEQLVNAHDNHGLYGTSRSSPPQNDGQNSFNPALFSVANKTPVSNAADPFAHMFSAALLGGGINRYTPHGA